jgi:hypothetical protein
MGSHAAIEQCDFAEPMRRCANPTIDSLPDGVIAPKRTAPEMTQLMPPLGSPRWNTGSRAANTMTCDNPNAAR